jgi:hypothetical protein
MIATMVVDSKLHIRGDVLANKIIFPNDDVLNKLFFCSPVLGESGSKYERIRARIWAMLKISKTPEEARKYKVIFAKFLDAAATVGERNEERTAAAAVGERNEDAVDGKLDEESACGRS